MADITITIMVTTATMDTGTLLLIAHHSIHTTLRLAVNLKTEIRSAFVRIPWLRYAWRHKKDQEVCYD